MIIGNVNIGLSLKNKITSTIVIIVMLSFYYTKAKYKFPQEDVNFSSPNYYSLRLNDEATKKFINSLNCSLDEYVAKYLLREPSQKPYSIGKHTYMYNHAAHALSWKIINKFLKGLFSDQESGFFIEAGAIDGFLLSNTLWLETEKKWNGLLVEPISTNYQSLLKKNRKVWTANACLSTVPYPKISSFQSVRLAKPLLTSGNDDNLMSRGHSINLDVHDNVEQMFSSSYYHHDYSTALCLPIRNFLNALNITVVDFFSLDIEGGELEVLKLFPWDKVMLRTLVVEYKKKSVDELISYMSKKGFTLAGKSEHSDYLFVLNTEVKLLQKIINIK